MANQKLKSDMLIQGSIRAEDNSTAETTTDATPRKIGNFGADGSSNNATPDSTTNNRVTVGKAGIGTVYLSCSFSASLNKTFIGEIYKNGVATGFRFARKLGTGGDVGNSSCQYEGSWSANDYFEAFHHSTDGGSAFTMTQGALIVEGFADNG